MESASEEKIVLIVEYLDEHLLDAVKKLKQVDSVLLYSSISIIELPSIPVVILCSSEHQLIDTIKEICLKLRTQMTIFSIYNQTKNQKCDLTNETRSFLLFQLFKAAFKSLPKRPESKVKMIEKYRNYYAGNINVLNEIDQFEVHYKPKEAIQWYINDSFVYRLISKALRTENIHTLCYFHFYIADLSQQLEKELKIFRKQNSNRIIQFYRGFTTTKAEIQNLASHIGNFFLTNEYLFATCQRQVAYEFFMKQNIQSDEKQVLIEYTLDLNHVKSIAFADISRHGNVPKQNEILVDLGK